MEEDLHKIADGFLSFYTGLYSGLMYYQVRIELPKHLNFEFRPHAVFGEQRSVPHGKNELLEYAQVFEDVSKKFSEWANHIRRVEAAQQSVQSDGACPECNVRDGYHKTGCKLWLWEPRPASNASR